MKIPPGIADVLRVVAPTLAAALAGPFAPLAAGIVTAALRQWLPGEPEKATPAQIVDAVREHADERALALDLRKAEIDLQKFEEEMDFRFAELEVKDRQSARTMAVDTGLARPTFYAGMGIVGLSFLLLFAVIAGCAVAIAGRLPLSIAQSQVTIAAFGLLGTVVGIFQGAAVQVLSYYYGSSAGSKEKTDQITGTMREMGQALAERPPPPVPVPVVLPSPEPEEPAEADWKQGPYGGQRWQLTAAGVVLEGQNKPLRTVGQPITIRRIWAEHGERILKAAASGVYRVPLELIAATIATESGGRADATLAEPRHNDKSVGLMQIMVGTAQQFSATPLTAAGLLDPAANIAFGTRYIASQRKTTEFQPPLVAAAYNAGGLYPPRAGDANPWRLRSTDDHISRFCMYYGDACAVAHEDGWGGARAA